VISEIIGARYKTAHVRRFYYAGSLAFNFTNANNWGPVDALLASFYGADRDILINGGPRFTVYDGEPMLIECRMATCTIASGTACECIFVELYSDRWEPFS
jgi:hypothetical protein